MRVQLVAASDLPPRLALDDDLLIEGDNARRAPAAARRRLRPGLHRPAVQHRARAAAAHAARGGRRRGRAHGLRRPALPHAASSARWPTPTRSTTTSASSAPRLRHARRLLADHGTLYVHLDSREGHYVKVLLDELFGRECFLNELVWAYDYGGQARGGAGRPSTTRSSSTSRTPGAYHFDDAEVRPRAVHGAGARGAREGGARQAPDRHLVAHDRADQRAREDRLPDAEARGHRAPDGGRLVAPGRLVPGLLRRLGHARRGGARSSAGASSSSTATPRRSRSRAGAWPATARSRCARPPRSAAARPRGWARA